MENTRRQQLIRQRAVARGMPSRIQNLIETGDQKINHIQVGLTNYHTFLAAMTLLKVN
jgi:hypothetical protein